MVVYLCRKVILTALLMLVLICFIQAQTEKVEDVILVEEIQFQPTEYQRTKIDQIKVHATADEFEKIDALLEELFSKEGMDIDALVQIIFFEVMKNEQQALEEAMQVLHKMNELKKQQREHLEKLRRMKTAMKDSLRNKYQEICGSPDEVELMLNESPELFEIQEQVKHAEVELASKEEESEALNLRLQMLTENRERTMINISEALDVDDETRERIIDNLK